ncbi:hypothetical protein Y032_0409g935 [Ancylostoma ceylanicum]|uniref:Uncharacterized protein n=1 Tax=Ancylostoma ceylanicum TaxID=53326 RepID=A0A016X1Z5_9BILA|nr:hypothetical protein Y032_0409g935 [Ancylostoma ceylanicum]
MLRSRSVDAQCSVRQGFLKKTVGSRKLALSPQHCPHPSKLHPPRNAKSTNHRQATYLLSRSRTHVQILQIRLKAAPTEILTFEKSERDVRWNEKFGSFRPMLPTHNREKPPAEELHLLGFNITYRPVWLQFSLLSTAIFVFYIGYGYMQVYF